MNLTRPQPGCYIQPEKKRPVRPEEVRWEQSDPGSDVRWLLLERVVKQPRLQRECVRHKESFLKILRESLEEENTQTLDEAVLIISEFINKDWYEVKEVKSLLPQLAFASIQTLREIQY